MAFKRLEFEKTWTSSTDFPTYQDSEEQARADLQYHPNALRDFVNQLLTTLESADAAGLLGAEDGSVQSGLDTLRGDLERVKEDLAALAEGGVPSVSRATTVTFTKGSWIQKESGVALTISRNVHKRESDSFGFALYQLVDGVYKSGTWGSVSTNAVCNADRSITLSADEAYSGKIVFFGM